MVLRLRAEEWTGKLALRTTYPRCPGKDLGSQENHALKHTRASGSTGQCQLFRFLVLANVGMLRRAQFTEEGARNQERLPSASRCDRDGLFLWEFGRHTRYHNLAQGRFVLCTLAWRPRVELSAHNERTLEDALGAVSRQRC
jgi:hypothetical protein